MSSENTKLTKRKRRTMKKIAIMRINLIQKVDSNYRNKPLQNHHHIKPINN